MTGRAYELRRAVIAMANRYAGSSRAWAFAVADDDVPAWVRADRATARQFRALQRLTRALADLSDGA